MSEHLPWILGIASSHNGAACLLHGSQIVVAIQEERLIRFKRAEHPAAFPSASVTYCLQQAGIQAKQLDAVVVCSTVPATDRREDVYLNAQLRIAANRLRTFRIPHHYGHAVAVHALSGMPSSGILVIDGAGSPWNELLDSERAVIVPGQLEAANVPSRTRTDEIISLYLADRGEIVPIEKHVASYKDTRGRQPGLHEFQSLGDMYGFVGEQIFASFSEGPGKVMGLAPYGTPTIPVEEFYRLTPLGFEFQDAVRRRFDYDERWPARQQEYSDLAASVQRALEDAVLHLARRMRKASECLAYAGGVALNSVANERIVRELGFRDVFIMPAAEDSGTAIGAAYYGLWQVSGYSPTARQRLDDVGRHYTEQELSAAVRQFPGVQAVRAPTIVEQTAELLADGKIVGWFQDGSELGPRALGQRSILCDPRPAAMKDVLNQKVKFREGFRPFAPIIPEEDVLDWFDVDEAHRSSPFMLRVMRFRPEQAGRVPAVVHVDGTGRVQTVARDASPRLHRLLTAFREKTGVPVLLNTSFNVAGEPIVETPADALWGFLYTDMDYCVVGDHLVSKPAGIDFVLDMPLLLMTRSLFMYGEPSNGHGPFLAEALRDTPERAVSAHVGRMEEIPRVVLMFPWLRLIVLVPSAWGETIHGLPGGLVHILRLIDGHRTGREIYDRLIADMENAEQYPLARYRRHLGLLKRIGAIGFNAETQAQVVPAA